MIINKERDLAIAKALGVSLTRWKFTYGPGPQFGFTSSGWPSNGVALLEIQELRRLGWQVAEPESYEALDECPSYSSDVQSTINVWLQLSYNDQAAFGNYLLSVIGPNAHPMRNPLGEHDIARLANATACDRAEALARLLGVSCRASN